MKKITIYTSETCPYCKTIKEKLEENDIKFEERLTSKFEKEWNEIVDLTGLAQLPTVVFNDNYLLPGRDFVSPEHIIGLLKESNKSSFPYEKITLERIKTLNFNIFNAFNRLDGVLRNIENKLNKKENGNKRNSKIR